MNNNIDDPYNIASKSMDELLRLVCGRAEDSLDHQYAKVELKKRELLEQHRLNEKIIKQQHSPNLEITKIQTKTTWRSTMFGALCAIIGAVVGAVLAVTLPQYLQKQQPQKKEIYSQESSQQKALSMKDRDLDQIKSKGSPSNKKAIEVSKQPPIIKVKNR